MNNTAFFTYKFGKDQCFVFTNGLGKIGIHVPILLLLNQK